jgi:hypothetical protein
MKYTSVFTFFFSLTLFLYCSTNSFGNVCYSINFQDSIELFDQEKLESYKADDDFDYTEKAEQSNWWTDFKEWLNAQWQKLFGENYNPDSFWFLLLSKLPYLIIPLAFVLLVWFLARSNPGNQIMRQHNRSKVILSEEEELLMKRDLESLAEEAMSNEEYRPAIRYLYLHCIKRLDMKRIISYANDKTNYEYVKEIKVDELARIFKSLTLSYEQIWYGHMVFDMVYFEKYKKQYQGFHNILDQKEYA